MTKGWLRNNREATKPKQPEQPPLPVSLPSDPADKAPCDIAPYRNRSGKNRLMPGVDRGV
ncbi:hypothetical protein FPJ27_01365 [Burkholderia sp. MS455]|nr:hypothetical protein FPJ27_01365 [Burkholderia sp. MS455]